MQLWLNHFGSGKDGFLRYVEFFCFKDFLNDNGMPKDLLDGGEINFWNSKYVKKFSEYAVEDLEKILNNLNKCVLSRSEAIEKILKITVQKKIITLDVKNLFKDSEVLTEKYRAVIFNMVDEFQR